MAVPSLHAFIDTLHWYYELLRLPVYLLPHLGSDTLLWHTLLFRENLQALPGTLVITMLSSPRSRTPVRPNQSRLFFLFDRLLLPATFHRVSALTQSLDEAQSRGSLTLLPTLNLMRYRMESKD